MPPRYLILDGFEGTRELGCKVYIQLSSYGHPLDPWRLMVDIRTSQGIWTVASVNMPGVSSGEHHTTVLLMWPTSGQQQPPGAAPQPGPKEVLLQNVRFVQATGIDSSC